MRNWKGACRTRAFNFAGPWEAVGYCSSLELCDLMNSIVYCFLNTRKIHAQRDGRIGQKRGDWKNEREAGFGTDVDFGLGNLDGW